MRCILRQLYCVLLCWTLGWTDDGRCFTLSNIYLWDINAFSSIDFNWLIDWIICISLIVYISSGKAFSYIIYHSFSYRMAYKCVHRLSLPSQLSFFWLTKSNRFDSFKTPAALTHVDHSYSCHKLNAISQLVWGTNYQHQM